MSTRKFSPALELFHYDNISLLGPPNMRGAIVFSGSSHPTLVDGICDRLGMKRGTAQLSKFANGETSVQIRPSPQLWPCCGADGV
jgi:ribose-phosphate pyrophosphokinase